MISPILEKYHELVEVIMDYESDTFSASDKKLKKSEAKKIAEQLIIANIQDRIDMDTMDGLDITDALEEIRDENNDDAS